MSESTSPKSGRSILNLDGSPSSEVRISHPSSMLSPASLISPSSSSSSPSTTVYSDRFIPSRTGSNFALFNLARSPTRTASSVSSDGVSGNGGFGTGTGTYSAALRSVIFGVDDDEYVGGNVATTPVTPGRGDPIVSTSGRRVGSGVNRNIFRYMTDVGGGERVGGFGPFEDSPLPGVVTPSPMVPRKVSRTPYKVLDAPALQDDFYLNLVDWSSNNVLAVGLGNCVYLWNACTSKVTKLCELGTDDSVCSVGWEQRGTHLSVGTNLGEVQIWDASKCQKLRTMEGHRLRVGALAWSMSILSSGGRDKTILHHDIRSPNDCVMKLTGHKSEVCGLKWSYDNCQLASGGNDNKLLVWNQHSRHPILKYSEHTAAVKAIAWSPHLNGLLASGGGTADRCIRFWNTTTNTQLSSLNTGSQVCNLVWSKNVNEVVSTHGYSQNQIIVWRYPTMSKIVTLTGHTFRVLYLTISPDGQTIVTGAGDETLRFWNVFPCSKSQNTARDIGSTSLGRSHIR